MYKRQLVQRFIAAFELINGKAVFRSLILNGPRLLHDSRCSPSPAENMMAIAEAL